MPVNLQPPDPETLLPVAGVELGVTMAGIRKPNRRDLLVARLVPGTHAAAVFTKNRFCAAPVVVARDHLAAGWDPRAIVVNTGNANAGTGERGLSDARAVCSSVAQALGCAVEQVLPFSTGVIMEPLPVDRILAAIPAAIDDLRADRWALAAEAIMTTDTVPKASSRRVQLSAGEVRVTGIAKGAGMIRPDMATMLAFIATDAQVGRAPIARMVRDIAETTFNCITVDGDTSTNDALVLLATGASGVAPAGDVDLRTLERAVHEVALTLSHAIVRDAEGATKFVTISVEGGRSRAECRQVAYAIAHSPLVKTAFFASDPNLGRILAAIGYAGVSDLDVRKVDLYLDEVRVVAQGGRDPAYREAQGAAAMKKAEFSIRVHLHRGAAAASVWTSDLSHDYVSINADYRS